MKYRNLSKVALPSRDYIGRVPDPGEMGEYIDEPTVICVRGRPVIAYLILPESDVAEMRHLAQTAKMVKSTRQNGVPTKSAVFGVMPRSPARSDYCRYTSTTRQAPEQFEITRGMNLKVADYYRAHFPAEYDSALGEVRSKINADWRHIDTPFLTCNINVNHAIKYHIDAGNMRRTLSNVLILKENITGGHLVCPEFGITFSQRDRALVIFDGQSILHGVTPIMPTKADLPCYRASIVFYTMHGMCSCADKAGEIRRMQDIRTQKENKSQLERKMRVYEMNKRLIKDYDIEQLKSRYSAVSSQGNAETGDLHGSTDNLGCESDRRGIQEK